MKKRHEWFSAFRFIVPSDFEEWMERLAMEGWNVEKIGQWSSLRIAFVNTEPKNYRYVYDVNTHPTKDYRDIYAQFGWEFVGQMASCFIWRKAYTEERPESFSDEESVMKRNLNAIKAGRIALAFFAAASVVIIACAAIFFDQMKTGDLIQLGGMLLLTLIITACIALVTQKVKKAVRN